MDWILGKDRTQRAELSGQFSNTEDWQWADSGKELLSDAWEAAWSDEWSTGLGAIK